MNSHQKIHLHHSASCLAVDVGCDWTGRRKDVVDHQKLCPFITVRIPLLKVKGQSAEPDSYQIAELSATVKEVKESRNNTEDRAFYQ